MHICEIEWHAGSGSQGIPGVSSALAMTAHDVLRVSSKHTVGAPMSADCRQFVAGHAGRGLAQHNPSCPTSVGISAFISDRNALALNECQVQYHGLECGYARVRYRLIVHR
jgi:hypothetical protein